MMRLVFSDLRDHAVTWLGAFFVAVACGYIGGWAASLHTTAGSDKTLQAASSAVIVFSLVAAVAVLASAANLTVGAQRRSYALWQLANVRPRLISGVVLAQLAVVAMLGALCGTLLAAITFAPLFPLMMSARGEYAGTVPHVGTELLPNVWLGVAGVFLLGGLGGARRAKKTSPLAILRNPESERRGMTWLRLLLFIGLTACTCWIVTIMIGSTPDIVMNYALYMPILMVATLAPVAPLVFSVLLRIWTRIVPQRRFDAWYLARHAARFGLAASTSVETPIMVGFGLVAGIYSVVGEWADLAQQQGNAGFTGLDSTTTILLLGGPVLLCAVGAAVSVVMSSRSRTSDVALLIASGARPETLLAAAACEALIHAVTATLVGMIAVVASSVAVAYAVGLPFFGNLLFSEGFFVSLTGFVLVLVATMVPTWAALNREAASVLAVQE